MSLHVRLPRKSHRPLIAAATCGLVFLLAAHSARAAYAAGPPYPRVNMATCYEVDTLWPKRPADAKWGDMPGIAVSAKDEVYLFTRAKPPVQVYDRGGKFLRAWGDDVLQTAHYLKLDHQGNVWVADIGRHTVMQFTPQGKLLRTLGTPDQPGEDAAHLNKPTDMAVTPEGEVFVTDGYGNNRVVHFDAAGKFVKSWGRLGTGPGEFSLPHAIAMDSKGRLYVADRNNARIQVFDRSGKFIDQWRDLLVPWGITMTESDELWVCGSSPMPWAKVGLLSCPPKDQVVMRFAPSGKLLQLWTIPKGEDGRERPGDVNWLHAAAVDSHGDLYVGDIKGQRAQKFVRQE
jgi:streptogramin lyase